MKKHLVVAILVVVMTMVMVQPLFAHSGGLDQNGGHWDHSTGTYHYHRGPRY